jgi:hypothetical protein
VDFGGAVIDAGRPDFAKQAGDYHIVRDPELTQNLHAAVDDAPPKRRAQKTLTGAAA